VARTPTSEAATPRRRCSGRPLLEFRVAVSLFLLSPIALHSAPALAQQDAAVATHDTTPPKQDTARVSYRTQEVVFLTAGRSAGLAVGDTVELMGQDGAVQARAVLVSVAQRTASATLIPPNSAVAVGQLVRFQARPPVLAATAAPAPDTTAQISAPVNAHDTTTPPPPVVRPQARWRGNIQLDQAANSAGGPQAITSYQTSAAFSLTAPVAPWLTLATRSTSRWRNASTSVAVPAGNSQTMVYQLEARIAPPDSRWNFSLGRFVPADAAGLGFIDGARVEVEPGASQRLGVVAGYAPDVFTLHPSSSVSRAGAYWAVTTPALSGSLGGAAEWQGGARRRTWITAQSFWAPSSGMSFSFLTDLDYGSGWQSFRGLQVTDLSAGLRTSLPFGFRAGLGVETHQALQLWALVQMGDTLPVPGRLVGFTGSLGRDVLGSSVDVSASYLKRSTDPSATLRGTFTIFNRHFMVVATGQHGDLFNYGSLLVRLPVPLASMRLMAALGFAASATVTPSGAQTLWRYGVRPEMSYRLGGGLFLSGSADIGRYAGQTSTFVRVGVSYQLF
jgi:hypothetical protein